MILEPNVNRSKTWYAIVGGVVIVVALGLWAISSAAGQTGEVLSPATTQGPRQIHGSGGDALDWSQTPGVSLEQALARMRGTVSLPEESVAGPISRVVVDETATDAEGNPGLLVLYRSGVKLMIAPGVLNLDETEAKEAAPFEDGTKKPFLRSTVAGRDSLVAKGGIQVLPRGEYRMDPRIMWNMNGFTYSVVAGTDSVTLGDLMKVAQSIR